MARYRTLNVDVDIYLEDVLDELTDDELIAEIKSRKLQKHFAQSPDMQPQPYVMDYFELAHEALLQGRINDAMAFLDRGLFPTRVEKTADGQLKYRHALS